MTTWTQRRGGQLENFDSCKSDLILSNNCLQASSCWFSNVSSLSRGHVASGARVWNMKSGRQARSFRHCLTRSRTRSRMMYVKKKFFLKLNLIYCYLQALTWSHCDCQWLSWWCSTLTSCDSDVSGSMLCSGTVTSAATSNLKLIILIFSSLTDHGSWPWLGASQEVDPFRRLSRCGQLPDHCFDF